ncbi:hypothetical protein TrVFT333_010087 [Trichoderma virens FT-333]|nr:hypothetical protein TrVFT333_010087 [Trichoderma virens FT-333]
MKEDPQSVDLFLVISRAAAQRQRESIEQREKQQRLDRKWKEEHVLKPQRAREEEAEAEEKTRKLIAELFEQELTGWREKRFKAEARNYLSRAEVDAECELELVEEGQEEGQDQERKDKEKKVGHIWDWWDGAPDREPDTDSVAEAVEMWERRRRGARLEPVGGVAVD